MKRASTPQHAAHSTEQSKVVCCNNSGRQPHHPPQAPTPAQHPTPKGGGADPPHGHLTHTQPLERKQQSNWAQGRPTHGSETRPNRTHNNTQGNHEVRALQQPPNAAHAERAISKHPPPFPLQGAHVLHKGGNCALRAGRCPPRGWQQGRDQPTAHGTVHVVWRCETLVRGSRRGQEGVRDRGTQERQ